MKSQAIAALALACTLSFGVRPAMATSIIGATLPEQIVQQAQLLAQYEKQLQQATTQVNSYIALEQQLKALPQNVQGQIDGVRQSVSGGGMSTLQAAQQMLTAMQNTQETLPTLQQATAHAYSTVNLLAAQGHNITLSQYELGMSALAQQHVQAYQQALTAYQQQSEKATTNMQKMATLAAQAPQIKSEVGGMTALLQSNAVLGQQLSTINASLLQNAVVQTTAAQDQAQQTSDRSAKESVDLYQQGVIANRLLGTPPPSAPVSSTGNGTP